MKTSDTVEIARILEWDSTFFGQRIGRVIPSTLTPELVSQLDAWSALNDIHCMYFLAKADNNETIELAERNHFHLVDIRVSLLARIAGRSVSPTNDSRVRFAREPDITELRSIAGANHTNSRFFSDYHFDREKCAELYRVWIEKSVKGMADRVFVWDEQGKAAGYVTAVRESNGTGAISLVGISPAFQGKGIGRKLICASLDYFASEGITEITTVTQGANLRALNLYEKSGFVIHSIDIWYHKWFTNQG